MPIIKRLTARLENQKIHTMAFSKAERVMISPGQMFFSKRLYKVVPTESHSANFSGLSAGNEDEPGSVIPRASAALAIVFAVYIFLFYKLVEFAEADTAYPSTRAWTRACMPHCVVPFSLCF